MLATVCHDTVSFGVEQTTVTISDESFLLRLCDTSTYMYLWAIFAVLRGSRIQKPVYGCGNKESHLTSNRFDIIVLQLSVSE